MESEKAEKPEKPQSPGGPQDVTPPTDDLPDAGPPPGDDDPA
jgi:hypothetical protein